MRTRPFFAQIDERKLKYHFRLEFDCILQYFSPPLFYTIHLRVNKAEKENPTETFKHILFCQVKSYKDKTLSVGSLLLRIIPWNFAFYNDMVPLLFDCKFCLQIENSLEFVKN